MIFKHLLIFKATYLIEFQGLKIERKTLLLYDQLIF